MKLFLHVVLAVALGLAGIGCVGLVVDVFATDAGRSVDSGDDGGTFDGGDGGASDDAGQADAGERVDAGSSALEWDPGVLWLVAGDTAVIDLSKTLPVGIARGGTFSIDPSGQPLPTGVTLTPSGQLSGGGASMRSMTDVVFVYSEP